MLARIGLWVTVVFAGCSAVAPGRITLDSRLAAIPLENAPLEYPLLIRWNDFAVPYIEAQSDGDLAFGLGLVHAHLRGAQLAVLKRMVQGRLSETAGPFTTKIDHALRILDLGKAVPAIEAALPPDTRQWLARFVDGLNFYQQAAPAPPEFGILGLAAEAWTVRDVLALARLAGADVTWFVYVSLLAERRSGKGDDLIWKRLLASAGLDAPNLSTPELRRAVLTALLSAASRSGSNSLVIGPGRSASGAPLMANDPHLGLALPNFWILAGVRSPSYQVAGMMPPGVPIFGIGRSPQIAWGGTNMRAAASDIVDVTELPPSSFKEEAAVIRRRWWPDAERRVRRSPFGPVISDSPLLAGRPGETLALRWMGHAPSDEISAFLEAARAENAEEFRRAFKPYAVSAQNVLFADAHGAIGMLMASRLPVRAAPPSSFVRLPAETERDWAKQAGTLDLPLTNDPPEGFIASANNRPAKMPFFISPLFSDDERVLRLAELVRARPRWTLRDLAQLQRDVQSRKALALRDKLVRALPPAAAGQQPFLKELSAWDGSYAAASRGALLFELLLAETAVRLYGGREEEVPLVVSQWSYLTAYMPRDLSALDPAAREELLAAALDAARRTSGAFTDWGSMHRVRVQHLLGRLPVIGRWFRQADRPASGSRETVMKTSHGLERTRHWSSYGSQSRHLSDLADPDRNFFVLFGGQDGFLGSANFADQVGLWERGEYIRLPLRPETVQREFPRLITVRPKPHA